MRTALYPGTFDPVTNGHMDIIRRATKIADRLVVGVAVNAGKGPIFSVDERVALVRGEVDHLETTTAIDVVPFDTLLMHCAENLGASIIIRGLRAVSDFEYEFQMVAMNQQLNDNIETVFLMADPRHQAISSRLVKEIGKLGGDISRFVSPRIESQLLNKLT